MFGYSVVSSVYSQDILNNYALILAQCRNLQLAVTSGSKPSLMYSDLRLIEGTTVDFICPPGLVLNGNMSATCTGNGEWEPDPQGIECVEG